IDGQMQDVISLQDSMAKKIVADLSPALGTSSGSLVKRQTSNFEAHDLYLKGHFFWNQRTAESMRAGISYLKQAIAKDPNYALAWAELSSAYSLEPAFGDMASVEIRSLAREAAEKAVTLDPGLAEAHTALGISLTFNDWNFTEALAELDKAIKLDPQNSFPRLFRAWPLFALGRGKEATADIEQARKLDRLSPIINTRFGTALTWMGRNAEAERELNEALEIDPNNLLARFELGLVLALQGKYKEARINFPDAIDCEAGRCMSMIAFAAGREGRTDDARAIYKRLEARARDRFISPEALAIAAVGMGDKELALDWLEKAVEQHSFTVIFMKSDPEFAPLMSSPRFKEIANKVGI
ncbi:MAG TPA: tetratricopeptide repeat protein, partial [Gemmatimonadaceae bacterium]|nr:tetratricopeptide repeat protein [Gemmatimonadaceae bacterium]